eukprot:767970-Hanusia_phi.AAC.2
MSRYFSLLVLLEFVLFCTSDLKWQQGTYSTCTSNSLRGGGRIDGGASNLLLLPRSLALLRLKQMREQQNASKECKIQPSGPGPNWTVSSNDQEGHGNETKSTEVNVLNEHEEGLASVSEPFVSSLADVT